jgi:hypothetical protein
LSECLPARFQIGLLEHRLIQPAIQRPGFSAASRPRTIPRGPSHPVAAPGGNIGRGGRRGRNVGNRGATGGGFLRRPTSPLQIIENRTHKIVHKQHCVLPKAMRSCSCNGTSLRRLPVAVTREQGLSYSGAALRTAFSMHCRAWVRTLPSVSESYRAPSRNAGQCGTRSYDRRRPTSL